MKAATAVFAGVCLIAVAALAEPAKKPAGAAKVPRAEPPIESFAFTNVSAFPIGEFPSSCAVDQKRKELTMKTTVLPAQGSAAYGGCCFENTEALPLDASASAAASLNISRTEEMVHVKVEQSSGIRQAYLHNGRLEAGPHELASSNLSLPEVRRVCVAIFGGSEATAHDTSMKITRVTFESGTAVKPNMASVR